MNQHQYQVIFSIPGQGVAERKHGEACVSFPELDSWAYYPWAKKLQVDYDTLKEIEVISRGSFLLADEAIVRLAPDCILKEGITLPTGTIKWGELKPLLKESKEMLYVEVVKGVWECNPLDITEKTNLGIAELVDKVGRRNRLISRLRRRLGGGS